MERFCIDKKRLFKDLIIVWVVKRYWNFKEILKYKLIVWFNNFFYFIFTNCVEEVVEVVVELGLVSRGNVYSFMGFRFMVSLEVNIKIN